IVVDETPVLARRQARRDGPQGCAGAAGEIDDGDGATRGRRGGNCVEHIAVARAHIVGLAQREPSGREARHATVSITCAKRAAGGGQVGSGAAAARAAAASRARADASAINARNAAARASTSSGGTSTPASAGTVSGMAPARVPTTGRP